MEKNNVEWLCGLPFHTPSNRTEDFMTIGELVENLIFLKNKYCIYYPDDKCINMACNVLDKIDREKTVDEVIRDFGENL